MLSSIQALSVDPPTSFTLLSEQVESTMNTDSLTERRRELPIVKTETVNLWNLLSKNIGKDLSKISMPVTLNEPLSTLQRLCEELDH